MSICNLVRMSTNNMLCSCSSYHKQLINMNKEIVYMQNLHMITFNIEGNEKHQHDIMLSRQHTYILCTLTVRNHIRSSKQSIILCRSKDQVEALSLHEILAIIIMAKISCRLSDSYK